MLASNVSNLSWITVLIFAPTQMQYGDKAKGNISFFWRIPIYWLQELLQLLSSFSKKKRPKYFALDIMFDEVN